MIKVYDWTPGLASSFVLPHRKYEQVSEFAANCCDIFLSTLKLLICDSNDKSTERKISEKFNKQKMQSQRCQGINEIKWLKNKTHSCAFNPLEIISIANMDNFYQYGLVIVQGNLLPTRCIF